MFEVEQRVVETKIQAYCLEMHYPLPEIHWTWIPFSGQWGISTSFFQLAASSFGTEKGNVPARAKTIAAELAQCIGSVDGFSKIDAVNGYLNLTFSREDYMQRVVDSVLSQGEDYGRGERNH